MVDELGRYVETRQSELNDRLTIMANIDQTGRNFIQDAIMSMLEDGACALVPIDMSGDPDRGSFEILSIRVGAIRQWYNYSVEVEVYDERSGDRKEITVPKSIVAIPYNPLYAVMNDANSTLRRLIDKLALLDVADARLYSKSLDIVLQLPYTTKSDRRQAEAIRRLEALEAQLANRTYGVGYIDATEKITQLNRPVTNSLVETVRGLKEDLHNELGMTPAIFAGTASEEELLQYQNRTVIPVLNALVDAMIGAFFSRTAIRQGNTIRIFPNLFKMAPLERFAEASDKFTRNAILSSNEVRSEMGLPPDKNPDSDALRNKNLNQSDNVNPEMEASQPSENGRVKEKLNGNGKI